ncbi:hypothetical protein J3R83DRAFT_9933 [Lanmaoa asiatica]|nr:hypothetical protein J3R83DRAFT_9933 [Lanmaoa asiatica]
MAELACLLTSETGKVFDGAERRLHCMAHVINLAMQAFLTTYSTSKHYDPSLPDADIVVSSDRGDRDPIGLIRAISVKARSSTQHKELFKNIQTCSPPCNSYLT